MKPKSQKFLSKALSVALASLVASAITTRVTAQSMTAQAIASEARLDAILNIAEQAAREDSNDAQRGEVLEQIGQMMITLRPTEVLQVVDGLLLKLQVFEDKASERSRKKQDMAIVMACIASVAAFASKDERQSTKTTAASIGLVAAAAGVALSFKSDSIRDASLININSLRVELLNFRHQLELAVRSEQLR